MAGTWRSRCCRPRRPGKRNGTWFASSARWPCRKSSAIRTWQRPTTQVDARADLYALGCTLYFALTGSPPFTAANTKERIQAHRHRQPEPVQSRNPAVPAEFAAIVHKLLAKRPEDRFASAAAVRTALKPWYR